ncbi:MAG: DUF2461 domain-containing protein [Aquaticitalea sp.]
MAAINISQNLFDFLKKLENNNDRDWFNVHKAEFKKIEAETKKAYKFLGEQMKVHDEVEDVKVFRIYRDIRFSKNKLPYKTHFGGAFHRKKPQLRGGYYLHLQPNNESFIAAGFWDPEKDDLFRIRKEFETDDTQIRKIIADKKFKQIWGEFGGDELKTAPKGFDKEHPAIDLIRKKQFIFTRKFTDKDVLADNFIEEVNDSFKAIRPYFNYMSDVLTTNLTGESLISLR